MRTCTRCQSAKEFGQFRRNPRMTSGYDSWCKLCASACVAAMRQERKAALKPQISAKECGQCRETMPVSAFSIERGRPDGFSRICRGCRSQKHRVAYAKDPEAYKARARASNARRADDVSFVVNKRVRARVREWMGTRKGGRRTFELLGYSLDELRAHLERQFPKGMGWHNVGEWHIDHIVPLSAFSVTGPDDPELRRAWALPNLRPLWAADNIRKGDKREVLL